MSLLDGGVRRTFGRVFGAIYEGATLTATTWTEDAGGDVVETTTTHNVKAHAPGRSAAYRAAAGFADDEIEVLVLADGLTVTPTTDHRLTYKSEAYSITRADLDGAHSHWRLRAKIRRDGEGSSTGGTGGS